LELYRGVITRKLRGVSDVQSRQRRVPSRTTLAGVVKHLAVVEREWFELVLAQRSADDIDGMHDDGWVLESSETVDGLLEDYARACAESRRVAAGLRLDDTVPHPRMGRVTLRWVYVHMIEETARHAGHIDILREQIDGVTGFDG
jgi:uncharacterized damage-inducible protein DinB